MVANYIVILKAWTLVSEPGLYSDVLKVGFDVIFVIVVLKTEGQEHQPDSNMSVWTASFLWSVFQSFFQQVLHSQTQSIRRQINRVSVLRGLNLEKMY